MPAGRASLGPSHIVVPLNQLVWWCPKFRCQKKPAIEAGIPVTVAAFASGQAEDCNRQAAKADFATGRRRRP